MYIYDNIIFRWKIGKETEKLLNLSSQKVVLKGTPTCKLIKPAHVSFSMLQLLVPNVALPKLRLTMMTICNSPSIDQQSYNYEIVVNRTKWPSSQWLLCKTLNNYLHWLKEHQMLSSQIFVSSLLISLQVQCTQEALSTCSQNDPNLGNHRKSDASNKQFWEKTLQLLGTFWFLLMSYIAVDWKNLINNKCFWVKFFNTKVYFPEKNLSDLVQRS